MKRRPDLPELPNFPLVARAYEMARNVTSRCQEGLRVGIVDRAGMISAEGVLRGYSQATVFAELLRRPEAVEAIDAVAAAAAREQVVVLCFEADQHRCHRDLVLAELTQRAVTGRGSRRRAR